jgi:NAD(P)-dependent dehydrogenase (short-subunit alcohol dehydrogenase family)
MAQPQQQPGVEQKQRRQPGKEGPMWPEPVSIREDYRGSGKLTGKVALISGGDSGIGRSVALHYAREGANVAIVYLDEHDDAAETARRVEAEGAACLLIQGDVTDSAFCDQAVERTVERFGRLDILVNNAAQQYMVGALADLSDEQIERTFRTNVFGYTYMARAAVRHLGEGGCIINTGSITGFRGHTGLIDYAATKGAITALTYSLASKLIEQGIRVNGVAPGPVWTPLIPASFPEEALEEFGTNTPMKRPAQPSEVGPAYVFLASRDADYINGLFIHINGGSYMP